MQRRSRIIVSVLLVAALVLWRWPRKVRPPHRTSPAAELAPRAANTPEPTPAATPTRIPAMPAGVRRLDPDRRKQLGTQIAAAIAKARAATPAPGPAAEDLLIPLEEVGPPLQDGLNAAIPLLARCYETNPPAQAKTAAAQMTMISDPALGTVIDTDAITAADGKPLTKQLDDCLRDTIDSLELPPLGRTGKVKLAYTFRFD